MLVLSRKPGEKILIGSDITITIVEIKGMRIRIGIDAPPDVEIVRSELNEFADNESVEPSLTLKSR